MHKRSIDSKEKTQELNELLFHHAADAYLDGIVLVDLQGRIIYVNSARARMHGYEIDELVGRHVKLLAAPGVDVDLSIARVIEFGHWEWESEGLRKDGSTFPVRQNFTRIDSPDSSPIALLSVTQDLTEEREARHEIIEAQELYRSLVENAIVGVFRSTVDGTVDYVNDAAVRQFELGSKEEAIGRQIMDFYQRPEDRTRILEMLKTQGRVTGLEITMLTATGKPITILVSAVLKDDKIIGVLIDISDKKAYEQSLQRSSLQLLELLDASREINLSLDTSLVMRSLVQHALKLTGAGAGGAGLLVDGRMVFKEYNDHGTLKDVDYSFHSGYGVAGWVVEHMMPFVTNDAKHDPQVIKHMLKSAGVNRIMNVPIISSDGRLLGCFELLNRADEKPFTEEDMGLLFGLANQAAVALNNAVLADNLKGTANELLSKEETLRLVVEGSPDFFFYIHDKQGVYTYISPSVEEITGYGVDEWRTHYTRFLTENPINQEAIKYTERTLETGETVPVYPIEVFAKGGRRVLLDIYERPIIADGKVIGIHGVARDVTDLRKAEAAEHVIREESEEYRRRFYRDTILSVTDGKLSICDTNDVLSLCRDTLFPPIDIAEAQDVVMARSEVTHAAVKAGMDPSLIDGLALCVGEATTNALKHAGGGTLCVSDTGSAIRVEVSDSGPGMDSLALPKLTLMRGYSTKKSLGMGYAAILALADKVYLCTGPTGTTVVIEMSKIPRSSDIELAKIPDLW